MTRSFSPPPTDDVSYYVFEDGAVLATGPFPHTRSSRSRDNEYDHNGRWIGADLKPHQTACRVLTTSVEHALTGEQIVELFTRYDDADYGTGEAGFAVYDLADHTVWLIDDAVRSPEGLPPARDPLTSPGPQTLLLPEDY